MNLRVRRYKDEDFAFVVDAWKRSYEDAPAVRGCDREHYKEEMTRTIRRLVNAGTVLLACDPTDEDNLVGFAAFNGAELHYVYIKQAFRAKGVARMLLEGVLINRYTFRSKHARPRAGWRYMPRFTI